MSTVAICDLTPRQQQILALIRQHIADTGFPPTRAEIAQQLGFRSPNAAEEHLKALARKGVIELTPSISRGIRVRAPYGAAGARTDMSKIRQSARNEECLVRIPGVCKFLPEYTILIHYPGSAGGKGRSIKSIDWCGAYCCTACDAVIDRQAKPPAGMTYEQCLLAWHEGHMRTLVRMKEKGLLR